MSLGNQLSRIVYEPRPATPVTERRSKGLSETATKVVANSGLYVALTVGTLALWQFVAMRVGPIFVPSPLEVVRAAVSLVKSGELFTDIGVSYFRVLVGWAVGGAIGGPLGLLAGRLEIIRRLTMPYFNTLRFIPPIALIGLTITWFGIGELSKISLIVYTAMFVVFLNVLAGAQSVEKERIWGAQTLGASPIKVFLRVVLPSTVPSIVTGFRVAMGVSFMTLVAAEIVAASSGVGYLIWNSRLFSQTDLTFVGIIVLSLMGLVADVMFRLVMSRVAHKYEIKF
jgi:ABC-type nitrate/sulfonate/bicarbonate transport system permease component